MSRTYQSIYVSSYRWIFRNFGQGKLPQFKSLFNVSFLLIIALTTAMLLGQLMLRSQWIAAGPGVGLVILFGAAFFMVFNYMVLLNNHWLTGLNHRLAHISRRNMNKIAVVVLVNVIIICSFMLFTAV
ncbi:MAG TPA: hypothetical protein VL442_18970 [Mucilaginibacter sp.]|nr:hypothetical protein [Mucilaginibacter sp.]